LLAGNIELGGLGMSLHQIAIIVATPVIVGLLWVFLMRTRLGLALRAIGQNEEASLLVGLNVKALYGLAFAIAAALAGLSGVFIGGYHIMSPSMGAEPLLKALVVVVFGGLSSIAGPIAAAYLIGLFEAACSYAFGLYWTPTLLFAVLILTLMIRPQGLIGSRSRGLA
jgi:branched-chain amino acid transport system permease protein